jgi:hypothetical protein
MKALRDVAEHGEVVSSAESVHGEKYFVDGWLSVHTQESQHWSIRTVWIIDHGKDAPRLVTAYPGEEGNHRGGAPLCPSPCPSRDDHADRDGSDATPVIRARSWIARSVGVRVGEDVIGERLIRRSVLDPDRLGGHPQRQPLRVHQRRNHRRHLGHVAKRRQRRVRSRPNRRF